MERESNKLLIGITQGDINGVGPEVIVKALADERMLEDVDFVVYGDPAIFQGLAAESDADAITYSVIETADEAEEGVINIVSIESAPKSYSPGNPSKAAGEAARQALETATDDLNNNVIDALVTAPIDKATIHSDAFPFKGHTEFLEARLADSESADRALMIMCDETMRVALVTTHLPVDSLSEAIDTQKVADTVERFHKSLVEDFAIDSPRIAVLALNPHAGEEGLLGSEENDVIKPALEEVRNKKIMAFGPYAADGFFGSGAWQKFDGIVAMYHDQGLIPFKMRAMDRGVNFTAGLKAVRTSPDHGTAFDIAGRNEASGQSMRQAIYTAIDIVGNRRRHAEATRNPLAKQSTERPKKKFAEGKAEDNQPQPTENEQK